MAWWLSWLERRPVTAEVDGSSPFRVAGHPEKRMPFFLIVRYLPYDSRRPKAEAEGSEAAGVAELADAWDLKSHGW